MLTVGRDVGRVVRGSRWVGRGMDIEYCSHFLSVCCLVRLKMLNLLKLVAGHATLAALS
jgi:hypothetical protein